MKFATLLSILLTGIVAVKIENFDSSGVYFQSKGKLRIQKETLVLTHIIEYEALKNSTLTIKSNIEGSPQIITKFYDRIEKHLSDIGNVQKKPKSYDFTFVSNERQVLLSSLKNKVKRIVDVVKMIKQGDEQIINKLGTIEKTMKFLANIVTSEDMAIDTFPNSYLNHIDRKVLTVNKYFEDNCLKISVKVPVYDEAIFDLYKIINLPIIRNKNIVSLLNDFKYMIVSSDKKLYFAFKDDHLGKFDNTYIYDDKHKQFYGNLNNSPCLHGLLIGSSLESCRFTTNFENIEIFDKLDQNRFLFAIRDETRYTYSCGMDNNHGRHDTIQGTGLLYLESFCEFRTNENTLRSPKIDAIFENKDKFDFNLGHLLNNTLTSYLKPVPDVLPMTKLRTSFEKLNQLSAELGGMLIEHDHLLKNLIELLPTDNPEKLNSTMSAATVH